MSILNHTAIPYDMAEDVPPGATPDGMFMSQQAALIASQARRIEELEKGLEQLEAANQRLASTRSSETYHMMLTDNGAEDALEALDDARSRARSLLNRTGEG